MSGAAELRCISYLALSYLALRWVVYYLARLVFLFFGVWEFGGLEILGVCLFVCLVMRKGKVE